MEDYIDILIRAIREQELCLQPEYYLQEERERRALEALLASLDGEQRKLYLICEEEHSRTDILYEDALLRRTLLLAREVYR